MSTIKEIAKFAGVSTATVSYVLNGTKKISSVTTNRVNDAIKQLNYSPNTVAKNLRKGKTCTIGVIVEDIRCFPTPEILTGIGECLEEINYQMVVHDLHLYDKIWPNYTKITKYKDRIKRGIQLLKQSMVSGIIYVCMHDREVHDLVEAPDIPLVYAYSHTANGESYITYDDFNSARAMVQHLISMGHKKISVIGGYPHTYPTQTRLKGIQFAMEENNLSLPTEYICYGDWEYQSGYEEALKLMKLKDRPTAIFALNDIMAAGCYGAASELGIKIPKDISIAGFDNREISRYLYPSLTTMALPLHEIGKQSINILLEIIQGEKNTAPHIILPCQVISRDSILQ
jgi:Transcriptional regulators